MTRFDFDALHQDGSPIRPHRRRGGGGGSSNNEDNFLPATTTMMNTTSSSCRLMTLAPDHQSLHTLVYVVNSSRHDNKKYYCIESHIMMTPLDDNESTTKGRKVKIRTVLSDDIQRSLEIDGPMELLSVQGESPPSKPNVPDDDNASKNSPSAMMLQTLPRLLLYSKKNAYLLNLAYDPSAATDNNVDGDVVEGVLVSVHEPIEEYLDVTSSGWDIVRVRPAPTTMASSGGTTCLVSPHSCFAALLYHADTSQYVLLLHHGTSAGSGGGDGVGQHHNITTVPLQFGIEYSAEDDELFTDFCFAQTHGPLSLFGSLSILLLRASGDVHLASPIVFDGAVTSKVLLEEGLEYLEAQMQANGDRNTALWRQCKAASQYLIDVFYKNEHLGQYKSAQILLNQPDHHAERSAAIWPVQLQGPIVFGGNSLYDGGVSTTKCMSIEPFGSTDCLVGVAVGKQGGYVDICALSPTALLPRFTLENTDDTSDIEDRISKLGTFVERVRLSSKDSSTTTAAAQNRGPMVLVRDPVQDTLLHYVSAMAVYSLSTNALRVASRSVKGMGDDDDAEPVRTTAWASLFASSNNDIQGVVVPVDAAHGHELVATLRNGALERVDMDESRALHDLQSRLLRRKADTPLLLDGASGDGDSAPLYEQIQPLLQKIHRGLAGMGRITGSETSYRDITPDALAVAIDVKKRSDETIVLPLMELSKTVNQCRKSLKTRLQSQQAELDALRKTVAAMKTRMAAMGEKLELADSNATNLRQRSTAALNASKQVYPTLTKAQYEYHQDLKRLENKCREFERQVQIVKRAIDPLLEQVDESKIHPSINSLDPDSVKNCNSVLSGQGSKLGKIEERFARCEEITKQLVQEHGIASG